MRSVFGFVFTLLLALPAVAAILKLDDGTLVAAQIDAGTSQDVFVLVNGLIYATERWDDVASRLNNDGATVIRYALPGQPENLRLLKKGEEPGYFTRGLEPKDMIENLRLVLKAAHVTSKIHLVGLSYGASVAAQFAKVHPELVHDVTFVSPLVVSTDEYDPAGLAVRDSLEMIRFWENSPCALYGALNPYLCVGQDFWYDSFYKSIYQTYLDGKIKNIPAGVEEATYKKAVFHLIRAARDFDLREQIKTLKNVTMIVAGLEEKNLAADQRRAYNAIPEAERGELIVIRGTHHALPDEAPAALTEELINVAARAKHER